MKAYSSREQEFSACGGELKGRPDLIRDGEIVDYKTGSIMEYDAEGPTENVRAAYVRQLRIYGYLVKETLGWWPQRGLLLPLLGSPVEVALEPRACEIEASNAVALLHSYNSRIANRVELTSLGTASSEVCKWCPYKLVCPLFWSKVSPDWSRKLDGAAIQGTVTETPRSVHNDAAFVLSIDAESGSEVSKNYEIGPLDVGTHSNPKGILTGQRVRIVGLRLRNDGSLVPTQKTILNLTSDLPEIGY
jgi:hypothetical protein